MSTDICQYGGSRAPALRWKGIFVNSNIVCAYRALFYDTSSVTRQGSCHLPPLGKACRKSSLFLLKCNFCKSLWQSNKKSVIYLQIPINPSVRRVRRVYTLKSNLTYNYAMHFSKKTINLFLSMLSFGYFSFAKEKWQNRILSRPLVFYLLRQVEGEKSRSIGKSSSLPASILKQRTSLESGEKREKFCVGPTASRPGPMLFIVAATAVKLVVKL